MSFNLRKRTRLSYYEPAEPAFDDYLYCERCADFVYDYCSIHGPLLVVPDNKVPEKSNIASCVPRAALTIPHVFLHLAPSIIPGAGLGVFSTLTLPRGVRFGPYCGLRTQHVESMYCWQIYDNNNKRSHVLDAVDCDRSNWMRYVNCARHSKEQNLLAYQYKGQLYYRTIKIIPRYTELMVFYGSEFANALHINLSKYNSAKYYKEIIGIKSTPNSIQENNDDMQGESVTADQFHFIDENFDEDDSNKNSTEHSINSPSNILSTNTDDSSLEETARNDNGNKKDYKEDTQIRYECETCQKTFASTRNLKYHVLTHQTRYECETCQKTFASTRNLKYHVSTHQTRYECETCQKTFASTRNLKHHVLTHLETWKFNCEYCLFRSNKHYSFKQHVGKHTNTFKFSCETCPFKTNYNRSFRRHCFRHESSAKVLGNISICDKVNFPMAKICEICDFNTNSRKAFLTHMSKHKGNVYKCDNCSYSNHSKYNLSRHIARLRH